MAFVLKTSPIQVDTETLGSILLSRWNLGAMKEFDQALKAEKRDLQREGDAREDTEDVDVPAERFVVRLVSALGRYPEEDQEDLKASYDNGVPVTLEDAEKLTADDLVCVAEVFLAERQAARVTQEEGLEIEPNNGEGGQEPAVEQLKRALERDFTEMRKMSQTVKKLMPSNTLAQALKALESSPIRQLQKAMRNLALSAPLRDSLEKSAEAVTLYSVRHKALRDTMHGLRAEPTHLPKFDIPKNPIHESNRLLEEIGSGIRVMGEEVLAQGELLKTLTDLTGTASSETAASAKWTSFGVWVAIAAIIISMGVSGWGIYLANSNSVSTEAQIRALKTLTEVQRAADIVNRQLLKESLSAMTKSQERLSDLLKQERIDPAAINALAKAISELGDKVGALDAGNDKRPD